ncbi:MAG: DUF1385 domain-containing protein [Fimbriimonadaceae bacterium]|nr:DUF1385 domain-containing protein [Fimbriimonadaceae bacterium]QYK56314.1 MAG: DUF1385 domain-containing protein [Fimbriimonadaceae bacterium]
MVSSLLSLPVGSLASPVEPAQVTDSIRVAARDLVENGLPCLPVADGDRFVGVVTEAGFSRALAEGADRDAPIAEFVEPSPLVFPPYATGSDALRAFETSRALLACVVDDRGSFIGLVTPSRLFERHGSRQLLGKVGGMATPFGVYLTNGVVSGGVGSGALVATGALMFGVFLFATLLMALLSESLPATWHRGHVFEAVYQGGTLALFLLGIRLLPLSGIHAAEHMVVHALERGEDLRPEIVRRMPRVHPRCGTNLAVGAGLFLGIMNFELLGPAEGRLLLAGLVTLLLWRPLGSFVQYFITTKQPTDGQLNLGLRAGRQFLERFQSARIASSSPVQRLANSGIFQIMAGAFATELAFWGLAEVLHLPDQWRVYFGL